MSVITVRCPDCAFSSEVPQGKIPPRAVHATCPECGSRFPFSLSRLPDRPTTVPSPTAPVRATPSLPGAETAASLPAQAARPQRATHRFAFAGSAGEYFGVWIVNLLLKVVTIGLYSAWAKVRKRRYFYGNTLLDKAPFDYVADPWVIFRGWCLGALLFIIYSIGSRVSPIAAGIFGLLLFLVVPWVIVRSRIFSARNSTYRNIRFTFRPNYREAYLVYAGLPILIPLIVGGSIAFTTMVLPSGALSSGAMAGQGLLILLTVGTIFPYMIYRQKKFQVENSGYGKTPFTFVATAGDFYRLFFGLGSALLLLVLLLGGVAYLLFGATGFTPDPAQLAVVGPFLLFASAALYFFFVIYVQTRLTNLTWNATRLGSVQFASTLRTRDMAWLYLSSALAIFCSFGLMIPWAAVRLTRYRIERTAVSAAGELRAVTAGQGEVGAAGEEFGDLFGIEVGLGVG